MTDYNPTGTGQQTGTPRIQPTDLKNLIQKQGRATIGNQEYTLREPQANDPKLQAIANDPSFTITPIQASNGKAEYEITARDKTIKITIDIKTIQ